jgi:2-haloacid dehalogenase/putative hydrolase of the HAD superfamily
LITFDCYGTLVDWETGISHAIAAAAGVTLSFPDIIRAYHEVEPAVQAGSYKSYRDVLREVATGVVGRLGCALAPDDAGFLAESLADWPPFPDTNAALERLSSSGYRLGILSNVDDDLLAGTLRHLSVDFDVLVTAEQVKSYKPAHPHFERARELAGSYRWLHAAQSWFHDIAPATELSIPVFWVNRKGEEPLGEARPLADARSLDGLVGWLEAS